MEGFDSFFTEATLHEGVKIINYVQQTENWPSQVYEWLSDNKPHSIESSDGQGGYPYYAEKAKAEHLKTIQKHHSEAVKIIGFDVE